MPYENAPVETLGPGIERRIAYTANLMTVVIDFTNGPQTEPDPLHAHVHEQTCYIAAGEIIFFMEGEEPVQLKARDVFYIPSGKQHGIQRLTEHVRLVDSFTPIREDFLG